MTKRVLVAPLDWGLGHATRCIPIINTLLSFQCDVIIGSSGNALTLLKHEFPQLSFVDLPAYNPVYGKHSMVVSMALQLPKFIRAITREHRMTARVVREQKIDIVISDNRYGCWSPEAHSIFMTHQLNIQMPDYFAWASRIVNFFNHQLIEKFNACWVPDYSGVRALAGNLSKPGNLKVRHIGMLSRFDACLPRQSFLYKVLVILSGPEPQRTILERILLEQIHRSGVSALMVRGVPGKGRRKINDQFEVVDFLETKPLKEAICAAEIVVARSGYSSIMDLIQLGKKAIFIPTPGQTEQLYLAALLKDKGLAYSAPQHHFDLSKALEQTPAYEGFTASGTDNLLTSAIADIIK